MLTSMSAGKVTIALITATSRTALAGTLDLDRLDHLRHPGTARSRLNAKVIRDAEVRHEVAQKNCAAAEMKRTRVAHRWPRADPKMKATPPPPTPALSGWPSDPFGMAKVTASRR